MYEYTKMPYGAKQMMLLRGDEIGRTNIYTPHLQMKGHWFYEWGFKGGDEVTLFGLADGLILMKLTKTREEFEREGWSKPRHKGLSYGQVLTIANDLLQKTQVFCQRLLDLPKTIVS
ncbi:MAG TPA: hypothetical protein VHE34_00915 [Puia sp.]|uniref:hypothetical protein n=1 Tax=Puia sp. TaxID=2045100 RepID=UPI002BDDE560|nr:hypothetical protein [Puia sp.]HVU93745.1 hypothetical protein [Puia sp.]